jgi:predicted esterase
MNRAWSAAHWVHTMPTSHAIAVTTHGRYLVEETHTPRPPLLVGFHGYAEDAETQLDRLRAIGGSDRWLCVSVQALHRFYRGRSEAVVASWMTRQDREASIADNLAYVAAVVQAVVAERKAGDGLVFAGFSQGVAMAFRAASRSARPCAVLALGGDIPPELDQSALSRLRGVLMGRGDRDESYSAAKAVQDVGRLEAAGVSVTPVRLDAGHEWTGEFSRAAGEFIARFA